MQVPSGPGDLSEDDLHRTAQSIVDLQLPNGMIQWYPEGHADPWNHVEAAMALSTMGRLDEAERAYRWLVKGQLPSGGWYNYYLANGIEDAKIDSNCVAYLATGVWHHYRATGDRSFVEELWPTVDRAIEFVLDLQTKRGEIIWARHPDGRPWSYALLTGSSSISHSLRCAIDLADVVDQDRATWSEARDRLVQVIAHQPEAFEPKDRWAMDWYYPVLTGAITGDDGAKRLEDGWETFVMADRGVRCVSDRPWITASETSECVMAHVAAGELDRAERLFIWAQRLRDDDGSYFTGLVFPEEVHFPPAERSTYTAAAIILAADALVGANPTSDLFTNHSPSRLDSADNADR